MPHIDDEFDRLIRQIKAEYPQSPQRDAAVGMVKQARAWARKLNEIKFQEH